MSRYHPSLTPGPWVALTIDAQWGDAASEGWGTSTLAYRLHPDDTVELRGGVAVTGGSAGNNPFTVPTAIQPLATIWITVAAWETGGSVAGQRVFSLSSNISIEDGATPPLPADDVYFFDGIRYGLS